MQFFYDDSIDPQYSVTLGFDLSEVVPAMSGPKRPQDKVSLNEVPANFKNAFDDSSGASFTVNVGGENVQVGDSSVVIAAITSCTNTSNPSVMVGAGLLARNARARGLQRKPWV